MRDYFFYQKRETFGLMQGWGAGAGRSRVFLAPWSRSRLRKKTGAGAAQKKSQEPEPLKNQPALQPCEKIKSIRKLYFSYSSFDKILRFMVKKTIILLVLYFFCSFTLLVCGEKNILPRSRSRVFLAPWSRSRSRSKKIPGAGAAWEKNQEPEPLEKKVRSRSR